MAPRRPRGGHGGGNDQGSAALIEALESLGRKVDALAEKLDAAREASAAASEAGGGLGGGGGGAVGELLSDMAATEGSSRVAPRAGGAAGKRTSANQIRHLSEAAGHGAAQGIAASSGQSADEVVARAAFGGAKGLGAAAIRTGLKNFPGGGFLAPIAEAAFGKAMDLEEQQVFGPLEATEARLAPIFGSLAAAGVPVSDKDINMAIDRVLMQERRSQVMNRRISSALYTNGHMKDGFSAADGVGH